MDFLSKMAESFGLVGVFGGAIVVLLFLVIKWTLATTKAILTQAAEERNTTAKERDEERKRWQDLVNNFNKALIEHTEQAKEFHDTMREANRYGREEHKEMLLVLKSLNGK